MIDLENEAEASNFQSETPDTCWQRSSHVMPRVRIVTEFEEYLIPWAYIALIKSDRSRKLFEIHTSLGIIFSIASREKLDMLYALLQLERVKVIYPIEGVIIKARVEISEEL